MAWREHIRYLYRLLCDQMSYQSIMGCRNGLTTPRIYSWSLKSTTALPTTAYSSDHSHRIGECGHLHHSGQVATRRAVWISNWWWYDKCLDWLIYRSFQSCLYLLHKASIINGFNNNFKGFVLFFLFLSHCYSYLCFHVFYVSRETFKEREKGREEIKMKE